MDTALYAVCAAAGWLAFGYKLRDLRRDRDNRVLRAMVYAFCSFAAGVTFAIPPFASGVEGLTGLPNLAKLLAHAGVMAIAAQAEVLLLFLALPPEQAAPRARRRLWASGAAFAVLAALWVSTVRDDPPIRLTVEYASHPTVTAYLAVYLCVFVVYSADITRLCWRFARISPRPWLRRGLRITAAGSAFGLTYCVTKAGFLAGYRLGRHPGGEAEIAAVLVTVAALLMTVGFTLPAWGPTVDVALAWCRRQRTWRRLQPLWRDITAALPHLVLDDEAHRPIVALRDIDYALHRRITEIRDGRLALRPFIDQDVAALATRLAHITAPAASGATDDPTSAGITAPAASDATDDPTSAATVEAAMIAAGIRAARSGTPAGRPDHSKPYDPPDGYPGEIAWLTRVATAYTGSTVVARILAQTAGPAPDGSAVPSGGGR